MKAACGLVALGGMAVLASPVAAEMFDANYSPCGDKPNTVEIVACVDAKTKIWDDRLNKAYRDIPKRVDAGQLDPLKEAQRLWIKYRDTNCIFYASKQGSIRQIQAAECRRSMTKDRALELEQAMKFD